MPHLAGVAVEAVESAQTACSVTDETAAARRIEGLMTAERLFI
jgi:hypothetical protein